MLKQEVIREFSDNELIDRLSAEKANLIRIKMNHAVSPLENPLHIRSTRRNIARLSTEINKRKK